MKDFNLRRTTALKLYSRWSDRPVPLVELLETENYEDASEKGFVSEVLYTTLRWRGRLEWWLESLSHKKPTGRTRKAMTLCLAQILTADPKKRPQKVKEMVDWFRDVLGGKEISAFANAVLRKAVESAEDWKSLPFQAGFSPVERAQWGCVNEEYDTRLRDSHDETWANEYLVASLQKPAIHLCSPADLTSEELEITRGTAGPLHFQIPFSKFSAFLDSPLSQKPWIVQDESSQRWISAVHQAFSLEGKSILDSCAAPGGKSFAFTFMGAQKVVATDVSEKRLSLMKETLERLDLSSKVKIKSPAEMQMSREVFDIAWIDAPCSSSGLIRRHPDIRTSFKKTTVAILVEQQWLLLGESIARVRPKGYLVYSVCSVFKEEGPKQVAAFLGKNKEFKLVKEATFAPHLPETMGDGFYGALLQRN